MSSPNNFFPPVGSRSSAQATTNYSIAHPAHPQQTAPHYPLLPMAQQIHSFTQGVVFPNLPPPLPPSHFPAVVKASPPPHSLLSVPAPFAPPPGPTHHHYKVLPTTGQGPMLFPAAKDRKFN